MKIRVFAYMVLMAGLAVFMGCENYQPSPIDSQPDKNLPESDGDGPESVRASDEVKALFKYIDEDVVAGGKPVIIAMDFDPATKDECQPIAEVVLRHCFLREIPVLVTTFLPSGIGMAKQILEDIAKEMGKENYRDYVFLGFKPMPTPQVILNMGIDFKKAYPTDAAGRDIGLIPAMGGVRTIDDIGLIVSISGSTIPEMWINFAYQKYQANVAVGTPPISATTYGPYFQSGQIKGFVSGYDGARAYERMLKRLAKKMNVEIKSIPDSKE